MAESKYSGCTRLAEILGLSHDCVNRFLLRERFEPWDLFNEVKTHINLRGGTLTVDDTVVEKPYRISQLSDLIGYFWSGSEHRPVKGINLITLYYTDPKGKAVPVNYRLYKKSDGKTKNDYFREMVLEVFSWGLKPSWVTGDCWYSSRDNLKLLKHHQLGFLMGIAKNRQVSRVEGQYTTVNQLDIPAEGLVVYLKKIGWVKVFKKDFKNEVSRYYVMFLPQLKQLQEIPRKDFRECHSIHWGIECYHRAIKQLCGIKQFVVRTTEAIVTHFWCSLRAFTQLELMRASELIENWYQPQRELSLKIARDFILFHLEQKLGLAANT